MGEDGFDVEGSRFCARHGSNEVPKSVLEAIKMGQWDFEPQEVDRGEFDSTEAVPGSDEKLAMFAERVRTGLPLWHPEDRQDYEGLI